MYTDVNIGSKTRKTELVESGPMYQVVYTVRMVVPMYSSLLFHFSGSQYHRTPRRTQWRSVCHAQNIWEEKEERGEQEEGG